MTLDTSTFDFPALRRHMAHALDQTHHFTPQHLRKCPDCRHAYNQARHIISRIRAYPNGPRLPKQTLLLGARLLACLTNALAVHAGWVRSSAESQNPDA